MKFKLPHFAVIVTLAFMASAIMAQSAGDAPANPSMKKDTSAPAQTSSGQTVTTMSVQVKVVNVFATVRDKHGKIVNNLGKDDFTLAEDGRAQSVRYFARETDLPLTLGLLVDTSMSQRRVLSEERNASQSFLTQMLREDKDKAFVIHFDRDVELLQDLTSSHEKLRDALESLEALQFTRTSGRNGPRGGGGSDPGSGHGRHQGGTTLYDAVYLSSDELMQKQQGRKALVVLSDGVDTGSKENLEEAIESAQRANTVVYSILFKDDEAYGNGGGFGRTGISIPGMGGPGMGGPGRGRGRHRLPEQHADGKKILERISKESGGRLFEASRKESVDQIYSQIQEELRNQYSLGYTPDRGGATESGYHKIQVAARQRDVVVQARDGYYGDR